ncbi:ferredoxin, 2Fe-2S [Sphingomonas sp. YR710]|jgi:2Fe-2S ferredoxin|nr:ferredoxin, 2Fe-2S [Sphingomonas sp. YR710]
MVKVTYIAYDGTEQAVDVAVGMTLMEGAIQNGIDGIEAVCGGNCYCGTCRVHVADGWLEKLKPAEEEELAMIEAAGDEDDHARLACQIVVDESLDGIVVTTPEFQK